MEIRLRFCGTRARFDVADETRAEALRTMARDLTDARCGTERARRILEDAASASAPELRAILALVSEIKGGEVAAAPEAPQAGAGVTFRQLAKQWTDGELHRRYPDHVPLKKTADLDAQRFDVLSKTIGDVPIASFALDDADRAMASLPEKLDPTTRRHYAGLISRLLRLAVYPCRIIPASPLPAGWLPRLKSTKAKAYLYPSEDRQLMGCKDVPLHRRMLWGFLAREGMRLGEALGLTWGDVDLERGAVRLDENKTDDPRAWALDAGVVRALVRFKPEGAEPTDLVFEPFSDEHTADVFRTHLAKAGINRPELTERTKARMPIRVHDLRGTFTTVALANGKSEAWVTDRTGHKSSTMIYRYKRAARTAAELGLGGLAPLDEALPELRPSAPEGSDPGPDVGPGGGPEKRGSAETKGVPSGIRTRVVALKGQCPGPG